MATKSEEPKPARKAASKKPSAKAKSAPKPAAKTRAKSGPKPGKISITKKKKTPAQLKREREARKKKAADAAEIKRLELRKRILGLREQGATIRQISEQLEATGAKNCKPTTVFEHLVAALEDLRENYQLSIKNYAQVRLNQMQRIELSHFKRLQDPVLTPDEFEKLSRGMDRIWKRMDAMIDELTGNKKSSVKVEVPTDGPQIETRIRVIMPQATEPESDEE